MRQTIRIGRVAGIPVGFNLLPGAPLDGGRVLSGALWWISGNRAAARRAASAAGVVVGAVLALLGAAQVLFAGQLAGLWLVLVGWFLAATARGERAHGELRDAFGPYRVADVMSSPAVAGYTSQTVTNFVAAVVHDHPHRDYPVCDLSGHLTGMISLAALAGLPPSDRDRLTLGALQRPASRCVVLAPSQPLADAAARLLAAGQRLGPVAVHGRLEGVLTNGDLTRAANLARLGTLSAAVPAPA